MDWIKQNISKVFISGAAVIFLATIVTILPWYLGIPFGGLFTYASYRLIWRSDG